MSELLDRTELDSVSLLNHSENAEEKRKQKEEQ
jgi:hypothetical protein